MYSSPLMTITAHTINITYNNTTRPITFVDHEHLRMYDSNITALVLYTFKDLIPDYQLYASMKMPFNIWKDSEVTFTLPVKEFIVNVQTLGHGLLELKIPNCTFESMYRVNKVKSLIEKELGIPSDCINLCNEAGENISENYCDYSLLYAVFTAEEL